MEQSDIESILWDCVTAPTDDDSHLGYQTTGVTKLAALLAEQDRRIKDLEAKVTELTAAQATEK
ncbi:hypothetical protein [Streptomyces sp. NPDC055105]|uniref:hypothetical protein n=1 Tax=Streptomyces sp. NPDC055105 TaxID=3365719 RepID=UPI0037D553B4